MAQITRAGSFVNMIIDGIDLDHGDSDELEGDWVCGGKNDMPHGVHIGIHFSPAPGSPSIHSIIFPDHVMSMDCSMGRDATGCARLTFFLWKRKTGFHPGKPSLSESRLSRQIDRPGFDGAISISE